MDAERGGAPAGRGGPPDGEGHRAGAAFLLAYVPDEDPAAEPTVRVPGRDGRVVPDEIARRFTELAADQVERCRAAYALEAAEEAG
ncbi:hypothetical protein [Kitasatospora phosalacinea]|uniref:hypothetical protein n=1 Tax=Kitasatospora phosalacinea TaxID=2065 RepID=UPI0009DE750F|nr:hypothetical protein [Kitasatospora phosalacinea]